MYLLSQDKKSLINFEKIEITSLFKSHTITAYGVGSNSYATVGAYDSEEQAKAEFNRIIEALKMGYDIYEVR